MPSAVGFLSRNAMALRAITALGATLRDPEPQCGMRCDTRACRGRDSLMDCSLFYVHGGESTPSRLRGLREWDKLMQ
jgi:hypothetical protein